MATAATPMPFEKLLAKLALHAHMGKELPKSSPIPADEAAFVAGAQVYKDNCAVCHGLPGQAQTAIAQGMFPKPPKLMEGTGVSDDPPEETYRARRCGKSVCWWPMQISYPSRRKII